MSDLSRYGRESARWSSVSKRSRIGVSRRTRWLAGIFLVIGLSACSGRPNVFTESRDERLRRLESERERLARTTDPVDRTRVQIRISELVIAFMGDAVSAGDLEMLEERLNEYRTAILDARDTMMNSGRDAARRSSGFKDLEIALRQHVRQLEDIGGQLTFEYREPLDNLITEVAEIREALLDVLFPG